MGKKKVLIIDDGVDFITAYKAYLEANDYAVITATSGKEGMVKLENENPNIVVLDVMMETPDSGFEFMNKMKEKGLKTPVILSSSIAKASQMNFNMLDLGVKAVMQKPIDLDKLVENVKKYAV
ncbi:MAG: response regulator [Candidatus Delongbacteria bacterium]|jgi:DNA-binding response OmpR family regulator|nr:response regulator [Candidatus Delongbacteria bacterium]